MELESNELLPDSHTFKDFRDPGASEVWRPDKSVKILQILENETHFSDRTFPRIRRVRRQAIDRCKSRLERSSYYHPRRFTSKSKLTFQNSDPSHSDQQQTTFEKREITTIQEEVIHYNKHSKSKASFKAKAYKEKVASLKVVVGRLKEMGLAKPEVLQNKVPEEVIKLFSGIQL